MSEGSMSEMVYLKSEAEEGDEAGLGAVGRLVDRGQGEERRMIRLVRARRLLYARNNMPVASYYARVKRLWEEVADEMGWTVADVRRKWSHIRNSYSRHLRNELAGARTGRGRMVSRWYLADELEFLRDHMATDTRTSLQQYPATFLQLNMAEKGVGAVRGGSDGEPEPAAGGGGGGGGGGSGDGGGGSGGWAAVKREPSDDGCSEADDSCPYFQFFRGLHPEYLELSAPRRRLYKRQCLALLHALLDEQDAHVQPDASTVHIAHVSNPHPDHMHAGDRILPTDD